MVAQFVGATLAAFTQLAMVGVDLAKTTDLGNTVPNPALPLPIFSALLSEVVGTMILAMTVLAATDKDSSSWRTSAIGVSLAAVIWALGGIGGASLNPARTFGPSIASLLFDPSVFNAYWILCRGTTVGCSAGRRDI